MESFGYAGRILRVDLSSGRIDAIPTSDYADRFLGGRGIATII
jgi:aldehyde:ferredoxin oxidoreductase